MGDRACLLHDWMQGDYVEDSTFVDGVDDETLDTLVKQSMTVLEKTAEQGNIAVAFSGGIDSVVLLHLVARQEIDASVMSSYTPDTYPTHREYGVTIADIFGYEVVEYVDTEQTIEWVASDAPIFPDGNGQWKSISDTYHVHLEEHITENNIDMWVNGNRDEHNRATSFTRERSYLSAPEVSPLKEWPVEYILYYLDRWSIPIDPLYHVHTEGPPSMWWRLRGDEHKSDAECWYRVRKACLEYGYSEFWIDRITTHFPDAESTAKEYADLYGLPFISQTKSYNCGSDGSPCVPDWYDTPFNQ